MFSQISIILLYPWVDDSLFTDQNLADFGQDFLPLDRTAGGGVRNTVLQPFWDEKCSVQVYCNTSTGTEKYSISVLIAIISVSQKSNNLL